MWAYRFPDYHRNDVAYIIPANPIFTFCDCVMPISRKKPNPLGDKATNEREEKAANFAKRMARYAPGLVPKPPEDGQPLGVPAEVLPELAKYVETLIPEAQANLKARSGNAAASLDFGKPATARLHKNNIAVRFKTKNHPAPISIGNPELANKILEKCTASHDYEMAEVRTERFIFKFFPVSGSSISIHLIPIKDVKENLKPRTDEQTTEPFRLTGGKDQLIQVLDQIKAAIDGDRNLRSVFEAHALAPQKLPPQPLFQLSDEERLRPPKVKWRDRDRHVELANLTAPYFILAVFGPEGDGRLGKGFTQADVKKIDPSLYNAIQRFPADTWPKEVDLPTLEDWNYRQLKALGLAQILEDDSLRKWLAVASGRAQRLER